MLMLDLGSRELNEFYSFTCFFSATILCEVMNVNHLRRGHITLLEVICCVVFFSWHNPRGLFSTKCILKLFDSNHPCETLTHWNNGQGRVTWAQSDSRCLSSGIIHRYHHK